MRHRLPTARGTAPQAHDGTARRSAACHSHGLSWREHCCLTLLACATMSTRIAACDLGKVSASMVVGHLGEDGALVVDDAEYVVHEGQPFAALVRWYMEKDVASCAVLGATGVYAEQLRQPAQVVPEDACQEVALDRLGDLPGTLNLVSIGGRGYSALSRLPAGGNGNGAGAAFAYRYLENDKCSSGTGENIQKMAARTNLHQRVIR